MTVGDAAAVALALAHAADNYIDEAQQARLDAAEVALDRLVAEVERLQQERDERIARYGAAHSRLAERRCGSSGEGNVSTGRYGILTSVTGFHVFDCFTGRTWGPFKSRALLRVATLAAERET